MLSYFHCFSVLVWKARRAKDIRIRYVWTRFAVFEIGRKTSSFSKVSEITTVFCSNMVYSHVTPLKYFNNIYSLMNVKFPQTEEVKTIHFPRFK